jgi:hypothetical protein
MRGWWPISARESENDVLGLLRGLREIGQEDRVVVLTSHRHPAHDQALAACRSRRLFTPPHHRWDQLLLAAEETLDVYGRAVA